MSIPVLVPACYARAFLVETLESALRQPLPTDDIQVVGDGSTGAGIFQASGGARLE
jgi:hypothetical protein